MKGALTRTQLAGLMCDTLGCDCPGSMFNSRCHPGTGLDVAFVDGALLLRCHTCKKMVTMVEVAP